MRAMDRHSRMARTLGCLVASMTLGAMLLDWVQPDSIASATAPVGLMAPAADGHAWKSIHVMPQRGQGSSSASAHWVVDRDGRAVQTDHWKNKRQLLPGGEVRVCLIAPAQSNDITPRQWAAALELVAGLQQECQIARNQVVVDDTLALPKVARPTRTIRSRN